MSELTNRCKKLEEENERLKDENKILKDEFDRALKDGHISVSYEYDIHTSTEREENERLRKKVEDLRKDVGQALEEIDRLKDCEANLGLICESLGVDSVTDAIRKISLLNS